jgi:hypothetical protein
MTLSIRPFQAEDEDAVIGLWEATGLIRPWNDPRRDMARKLQGQPELFLVAELAGALVGSVMPDTTGTAVVRRACP